MNRSVEHQDRSGMAGMPIGIFVGGVFREYAPDTDPHGSVTAARIADQLGPNRPSVEALGVCLNHPTVAAVDCTDCIPLED